MNTRPLKEAQCWITKTIPWLALMMSYCCLDLSGAAGLERIDRCGTRCSQGLRCKTKPDYIFHPPCQNPPDGHNNSFHNISLSTVMKCEGRQKCSLRLRVKTALQLSESMLGLSICVFTEGIISNCQILKFKSHRMSGTQVEVENDCNDILPSQRVKVTVKTLENYCGISWTGNYIAPGCKNEDLKRHVPECITGRLSYIIKPQRKELSVNVSDMLEDHNYHLRLCLKDFICVGTGAYRQIKKEEPVKSITFPYSRPLPCLCIEGLRCKTKPDYIFHPPCQNPPDGHNNSFHNISLSTVMKCEGRQKCSLRLRVKTALQLSESMLGLSICVFTEGIISNCQILKFKSHRMSGTQVEVENDCNDILPSQRVKVTVKTLENYCGISWTGNYIAPGCKNEDLKRHVPECITGRLSYIIKPQRKELSVNVSDMLEDHNYHLRLCLKDFICVGTGAYRQIKKEEPVKSITFPYSRPLPCLCIEGWSAVTDAPRVQVCPFKDRVEELFFGINFDPLEETLSWEPACPVTASVGLCQKKEDGVCVDLPHASQNVNRAKIRFTKVDPHPQLCMKFTTVSQSWIRCPFVDSRFQAWEFTVTKLRGQEDVMMLSQITANFSIGLCVKSEGSSECNVTRTHTVHVEKRKAVGLNLTGELHNTCLQVKRLETTFAATVTHCFEDYSITLVLKPVISPQASGDLTWVIVPVGVCLSGVIIVTLILHILLTVYQKRKQKRNAGGVPEKQTDPDKECVMPALQRHGPIPDSPPSRNTEKASLIA